MKPNKRPQRTLLTADVAAILRVTPDNVRYLERTGRLHATRTLGGVRLYNSVDVARLASERETRREIRRRDPEASKHRFNDIARKAGANAESTRGRSFE